MNARWRKSSYSGNTGGECVEVADLPSFIAVRDSKNPEAAHFAVAPQAWAAFVGAFK
ncbi:DUF397 domain-containing protein [Streptomyces sp. CoH27]|uniref:DUF397 domain-containing protein n=1 Tax=Streptomyces sp. CoH27 TaxID=2875763 RepID=UPI001CD1FCAF|nr:DUF397 domain-containing protein [Streptomyces sp. CoH27]